MGPSYDGPFYLWGVLATDAVMNKLSRMKKALLWIVFISLFCSTPLFAKKESEAKYSQLELQEDLQRFYTRFTERVLESMLSSSLWKEERFRERLLAEYLLYDSESLKIVTGPFPEINLLDMIVFIKLNRMVVRDFWIPKVWKNKGIPILQAFLDAEKDIDELTTKIISANQLQSINNLVRNWRKKYPGQFRVEKIRLANFSQYTSASRKQAQEEKGKSFSFSNLIVDTKGAVEAADQAVLLGNRALFLSQNMPYILRLQTRLGVQEILDDTVVRFSQIDKNINDEIKPLMDNASVLTRQLDVLAKEGVELLASYRETFPARKNGSSALQEVNEIVEKSNVLLNNLKDTNLTKPSTISQIKSEVRSSLLFIFLMLLILGTLLSLVWWGSYFLVKRKLIKEQHTSS